MEQSQTITVKEGLLLIPVWVGILIPILASILSGFLAAFITPVISSASEHKKWKIQRSLELRYEIFKNAVASLSQYAADCLDLELQSNKKEYNGKCRSVEMRPATVEELQKSEKLVRVFFSKDVADAFDAAEKAEINIEKVPNIEFEEKQKIFVELATNELGIKTIKYLA